MEWYEKAFGSRYLEIYGHRNEQEAVRALGLIRRIAAPLVDRAAAQLRVLDLACGAGRYSRLLAGEGHCVAGIDLSAELLAEALKHPDGRANAGRLSFIRADMRRLPFRASFDLALNMFTSFGYFDSDRENARVLEELAGALRRGGAFLIDYLNRDRVMDTLVPEDSFERGGLTVEQRRFISPDRRRVEKRMTVRGDGREENFRESVRLYTREEMESMLNASGVRVEEVFGDYDGAGHDRTSPRLILSGRKP